MTDFAVDAPIPEPTFGETLAAGASNSIGGMLFHRAVDALSASDPTLTNDAEIETRLRDENMLQYVSSFTDVRTRGELDKVVNRIARERDNEAVLSASGWGAWGAAKLLEGVLDPAIAIPGTLGLKVGLAGGSIAKQTAAFVAGGAVAGGASELERGALMETRDVSVASMLAATGGGALVGGFIGYPAARFITGSQAKKLGDAVRTELTKTIDGTIETEASALAAKVTDVTADVIRNPGSYREEAKALARMLGEEPTPSQIALARSLGAENLSRVAAKAFGKSVPLEMMSSEFATAREFASEMFMLRGNLVRGADDATSPISAWAMTGEINGVRDQARKGFLDSWKDWAAENSTYTSLERFLPANASAPDAVNRFKRAVGIGKPIVADGEVQYRYGNGDVSMKSFADLVTKAVVYGDDLAAYAEGELYTALSHPTVQKAAKAYRDFNADMGERQVRAGLLPREALQQNHVHRVYTDRARAEAPQLQGMEERYHFEKTWTEQKQTAAKAYADTVEKLRTDRDKLIDALEVEASFAPQTAGERVGLERTDALRKKVDAEINALHKRLFGRTERNGKTYPSRIERDMAKIDAEIEAQYQADLDAMTKPDTKAFRATQERQYEAAKNALENARKKAEDRARTDLSGEPEKLQVKLANLDKYYSGRASKVEEQYGRVSRNVSTKKYAERVEALRAYYNELQISRTDELHADYQAKFDARAATIEGQLDPTSRRGARIARNTNAAVKKAETDAAVSYAELFAKAQDEYEAGVDEARRQAYLATNFDKRAEMAKTSKQHAEGVVKAILYGETGDVRGGSFSKTGNQSGSRKTRNVEIPDHILLTNGWIDTDLLAIMNKQARQEGMSSVLAMKFRRSMTEDEAAALENASKEAYWRDGADATTVPDLQMNGVREAIIREALQAGAKLDDLRKFVDFDTSSLDGVGYAAKDVAEATRIAAEAKRMLDYVDEASNTFLGTHANGITAENFQSTIGFLKAFNFSTTLGLSVLTNTTDAFKAMAHHGYGHFVDYSAKRFAQRLSDKNFLRGQSTKDLRDQAAALSFGLEKYSQARMSGMADLFDPYAKSEASNYMDATANALSKVGGNLFFLNQWNNMMKSAAYGMAQFRVSKLALADAATYSKNDRTWLREIGLTPNDLSKIKEQLNAQGITALKGSDTGLVKLDQFTDPIAKSRFLAAMNKDVTTNSITPNAGSTPRWVMNSPLGSLLFQFQGFTMAAMESLTVRTGQQVSNGQAGMASQMVVALLAGATMQYMLKGFASGDLDKRMASFEKTPGQLFYQIVDNTGVLAPITAVNNMFEDVFGYGIKRTFGALAGDRGLPMSSSGRSEARGAGVSALAGAFGKQFDNLVSVMGGAIGEQTGSTRTQWNDDTRRKLTRLTPFNNAVPFYAATRGVEFTQRGMDAFKRTHGARQVFEGIIPFNDFLFAKHKF